VRAIDDPTAVLTEAVTSGKLHRHPVAACRLQFMPGYCSIAWWSGQNAAAVVQDRLLQQSCGFS
jgi:hypothetical protein